MLIKRYLKFANTPPPEQVAGTGLLNTPTFIGIFLFFLAFVRQKVYLLWVILRSSSVFAAHFIPQPPIKNDCSTYKYQPYFNNKHIFMVGKNKFIIPFRSGN